jgi:hypothetical protein
MPLFQGVSSASAKRKTKANIPAKKRGKLKMGRRMWYN